MRLQSHVAAYAALSEKRANSNRGREYRRKTNNRALIITRALPLRERMRRRRVSSEWALYELSSVSHRNTVCASKRSCHMRDVA